MPSAFIGVHRRLNDFSRSALAVAAMVFLTEAVYLRPEILRGTDSLMGSDYEMLHRWRLAFARESLFGARHMLPAWNPHELLGAPFAANLQSFPWIPTRLVLLFFDPSVAFGMGVAIAAALSAIFTFLFCRRAGLTRIGAATAGWTFACAGYFSSRVMAGHLPLLEAYPALPLLLWLIDRAIALKRRIDLAVLALCCTCVVAAGHPQIPAYALAAAFLYALWRRRARVAGAMALGIGLAGAIWWPMILLIGRSTRLLHLAAPDNDIAMPWGRLLALIVPGIQGWAEPVELADKNPFTGYPNNSYFWDTASYIGIMPLLAIAALLILCIVRKRMPEWRWKYLTFLGTAAFIGSLPVASPLLHALPGTLLRSPARLLYLSTFSAAVAIGVCCDAIREIEWPRGIWVLRGALAILLACHVADLWRFDHWFIQTYPRGDDAPAFQTILDRELGNNRIAEGREDTVFSNEERYDDAGGFDSIFLSRFNRNYLELAGLPADTNEQVFDASTLPVKALETFGVRFVITTDERHDLPLVSSTDEAKLYRVPNPAPRAQFIAPGTAAPARADYSRPSSDEIDIRTSAEQPGSVQILESYDPGWRATVDGTPAALDPANGFAMAVPVQAGNHTVRLQYSTPGRLTGETLSLLSLTLLAVLILKTRNES